MAQIQEISPSPIVNQTYSPKDTNLITRETVSSSFDPYVSYIEYTIQSQNRSYQLTNQDYKDYKVINNTSPIGSVLYDIELDPEGDLRRQGFSTGQWNVLYNFLNNELSSSFSNRAFYIKEISSDRTEIRLSSTTVTSLQFSYVYYDFKTRLDSASYFNDFYLNFGNNKLVIANNILYNGSTSGEEFDYDFLINLYEPLPSEFNVKDTLWVVTQVADPLTFNIYFEPTVFSPQVVSSNIKGPNVDLPIKDRINNSTNYLNYEELLTTGLSTSYNQILSYLNDKSINISIDYNNFSDFVYFSSAASRIQNFYYKVQLLEQYNANLTSILTVESSSLSSSYSVVQDKIKNVIENFDGFEYYLYFSSGSNTYPKGTTTPPYDLMSSLSTEVLSWYNEQLNSASIYDENNQNKLTNTIPLYLRDDPQNEPYNVFINMMGQHYDNIWIYYKDVTNRYNGDNRLNYGVSKDLVADAIRSFGLKIYQNNFSTNDLYNAFIGYNFLPSSSFSSSIDGNVYTVSPFIDEGDIGYYLDDVIYYPGDPTELITNYITASQEALYTPLDDVNKEIYKRIYHNLPLLLKQKGTISGLRNLINLYGIPDTILRISEFGGRDRDETTYDYFYERYNYAFDNLGSNNWVSCSFQLNNSWASTDNRPEAIQLRFKTNGFPHIDAPASQSVFRILENSAATTSPALILTYTGSGYTTASYSYPDSGSNYSPDYQYARLDFVPNPSAYPNESASVYLPFFDNDWWSVMVSRTGTDDFTLYAGNKLTYNGYDGNQLGFLASSSVTSTSNNYDTADVFYLGVANTFTSSPINPHSYFSGSFQELRFWTDPLDIHAFKDFVMNPSSTDVFNSEDQDYADYLAFRASLGNELYINSSSIHPKITGSWNAITQSFAANSNVDFRTSSFAPNIETFFFNSPIAGLRNRITDKIQIVSSSYPSINLEYSQSGNTLSPYRSIIQYPLSQNSETPDVNALEVAFSPTNEVDDDIISSLGYFNIGEYIGDPRQISSSATSYPDLNKIRDTYFQKYFASYTLYDYIRLIKFFDNSLFKMIKDFVPARTNLRSGVVVKQHLLERNKYPQPQMEWKDVTYSGSIDTAFITGSTGGTFNEFNILTNTQTSPFLVSGSFVVDEEYYINYFNVSSSTITTYDNDQLGWENGEIITYFDGLISFKTSGSNSPGGNLIYLTISSSNQGNIKTYTEASTFNNVYDQVPCSYGEKFSIWIQDDIGSGANNVGLQFGIQTIYPYSQQSWSELVLGPTGSTQFVHNDQSEFYNGELQGTTIEASNGELNEANIFKYPSTLEINYDVVFYKSNITSLDNFLNINTSPNQGEIYLWFDTGSILNPGQSTPIPGGGGFN